MNIVKVGFIGTGGISGAHIPYLAEQADVELVAMCDVDEARAKSRAEQSANADCKVYTDFTKMYEEVEMDAVYICLPPFAHTEQELIAADKSIAIFVEKPIATTMEKAEEIAEAIDANNVISSVGYHWRNTDSADLAKDVLSKCTIAGAHGYWMGGMPGVAWWRRRDGSGGQLVEQTTHIVDLCRYMVGSDAKTVYASGFRGLMTDVPDYDIEDMSIVNVTFENGAIASIASACMMTQGGSVKLDVYTKGLSAEVGGGHVRFRGDRPEGVPEEYKATTNGYNTEDRLFIDAIKSGDASKIKSPYSDALETHRLTMAANQSLDTGEVVTL